MNTNMDISDIIVFGSTALIANGIYYRVTKKVIKIIPTTKYITVANKLQWRMNSTRFMVGTNNEQFEVCKNIWGQQFDSAHVWNSIQINRPQYVIVYGMNIPILNIYRKIIIKDLPPSVPIPVSLV
jgi:hypothetical protein